MTLKEIENKIKEFNKVRKWDEDVKARDLAISVSIEASELLEHFQWEKRDYDLKEVGEEIADVFVYLTRLSYTLGLDLEDIILKKIEKNGKKYPKEAFENINDTENISQKLQKEYRKKLSK